LFSSGTGFQIYSPCPLPQFLKRNPDYSFLAHDAIKATAKLAEYSQQPDPLETPKPSSPENFRPGR